MNLSYNLPYTATSTPKTIDPCSLKLLNTRYRIGLLNVSSCRDIIPRRMLSVWSYCKKGWLAENPRIYLFYFIEVWLFIKFDLFWQSFSIFLLLRIPLCDEYWCLRCSCGFSSDDYESSTNRIYRLLLSYVIGESESRPWRRWGELGLIIPWSSSNCLGCVYYLLIIIGFWSL